MQIILTGATGLVGSGVLHHILSLTPAAAATRSISLVNILSRKPDVPLLTHPNRPTQNTHTKINVITHSDFNAYPPSLLSDLKSSSPPDSSSSSSSPVAVIWALGMSQTEAKSAEHYIEVTKTYSINAAKAFATAFSPAQVNFIYVSGEGATSTPGMFTPLFGKVKGETEQELLALTKLPEYKNLRVYNVRPAGVDPGAKVGGQPVINEFWEQRINAGGNLGLKASKMVLLPMLRAGVWKGMHTPTDELGKFLLGLGTGDGKALKGPGIEDGGWTVRNVGLRRLVVEMADE